jgi:hypothetical protein
MKKIINRFALVLTLLAVIGGALAIGTSNAKAAAPSDTTTFHISVYHGINGKALGLSKELPVVASVYKDGVWLTNIPLNFKDRFEANLPAGTYTIEVTSLEAGPLPSMTIDSAAIPAGVDVRVRAKLDTGQTPILNVRVK